MQFRRAEWDLCLFGLTADFIRFVMQIQHHLIPSSAPLLTTRPVKYGFYYAANTDIANRCFFFIPGENKLDMHYEAVMLPVQIYSTDLQLVKTSQEMKTRDCEQAI